MSIKNKIIKILGGYTFEDIVSMQEAIDGYRQRAEQIEQQLKEASKRIIEPVGAYVGVPTEIAEHVNDERIKRMYKSHLVEQMVHTLIQSNLVHIIVKRTESCVGEDCTIGAKIYIARKRKDDNDEQ